MSGLTIVSSGSAVLTLAAGFYISTASANATTLTYLNEDMLQVERLKIQETTTAQLGFVSSSSGGAVRQLLEESARLGPRNQLLVSEIVRSIQSIGQLLQSVERYQSEIECTWCADGSLLAELMLPNRRIGFSFEPNEAKSSWFIASRPPSTIDGSGYLVDTKPGLVLLRGLTSVR